MTWISTVSLLLTDEELAGYGRDIHVVADAQLTKALRGVLHGLYRMHVEPVHCQLWEAMRQAGRNR
jgi:hypothetical protein